MIQHLVVFVDVGCLMALLFSVSPGCAKGWDIPSVMRRRRHVAATRYRGAGFIGERCRVHREVVGLGCQTVEVPARKVGAAGDIPLAAES